MLQALHADITTLDVDAIVNAANETLLGGGGVDGAIHRAAGPGLLAECMKIPQVSPGVRCPTGEARLTAGHRLKAKFVIHTVGPVWRGGDTGEDQLLASCYRNALKLADGNAVASIAFPAISTGIYGFPLDRATKIAVREAREFLEETRSVKKVIFACFGAQTLELYTREIGV